MSIFTNTEINRPDLRPYQTDAINRLRSEVGKGGSRLILQAATGAGKTLMSAEIIRNAESKNNRTLFVCDSLELVEQAVNAFDAYGLDVGVMQGQHMRTDESRLTQVCTAQTLERRIKKHRLEFKQYPVNLIIHDEAHVQHRVRQTLCELYPDAKVIGLTATPFAKGMGQFYQTIVSAISMQNLMDDGYLSGYTAYAPFVPDMKGVKQTAGDWSKDASAAIYEQEIIGDIVAHWKRLASDRQTLAFGCNVAHSKAIAEEFKNAGVRAEHIDGYGNDDDKLERQSIIERYKSGEIQLLSSVGILTKGFDAPSTSALIIARPTKSLSLHWQICGRALRMAEGKDDAIILDHAGNFIRHGFPNDPIDFYLDDGTKQKSSDSRKKDERLPVPCPACQTLKLAHKCPACGFAPEKQNIIENVDGELVELKVKQEREKKKAAKELTMPQKQAFYSELIGWQNHKGYKDGWAANQYRNKLNVWPNQLDKTPASTSLETQNWIKSQQIRYAKGKAKANAA